MSETPKPKIILFDLAAIAAFLFVGLDALVHLFAHYLPPISIFFSILFGDYGDFFLQLHFWGLILIFFLMVLGTWGLIIKQVIKGWTASEFSQKVMPYGQLRRLFFCLFGGLSLFFYLEAISNLTLLVGSLWIVFPALSLFAAIPFALILGLFSVSQFLSQKS